MSLNPVMRDWNGKVVWLLGASSGIGRATASALHAQGATVFVSARKTDALNDFVAQHPGVDAQGRARAVALPLDAGDAAAVQAAAAQVSQRGAPDLVMYCAAYYKAQSANRFSVDEMRQHQEVNYMGAVNLLGAVLPQMLERVKAGDTAPGHISLISSVSGYRGLPKNLAYGPTKAALINLAESLFLDLQPQRIGVSLINPGFVETPLTANNKFKMPALITAEQAANEILKGWARGAFEIHFPKRFTGWLKFMRHLPYTLYFPVVRKFTGL
jgi:NAD(P)-dependent dehydrogenase (short-subunit alcohol dehydrogenase family)